MKILSLLSLAAVLAFPATATVFQFNVTLEGSQEVGGGDLDGSGLAILYISDEGPSINWDISINSILTPLTGAHIHNAAAGVNGPVRVDFSASLTGGPLIDTDLTTLLADPTLWYVNLHNTDFPGGAIRGQLGAPVPEPEEYAVMFAVGALVLASRPVRRRLFGCVS